jgi:serine/threonine protein kinase/tetratricopeptide (TPR) repeat protein
MAAVSAEKNSLFGLLALQIGLIDQSKLIVAFQAWTLDKARGLAEHLIARGDLEDDQRTAVEALAALHLKKYGGDIEQSLAAIPASRSAREKLAGLGDSQIDATLARVGSDSTDRDADPDRTTSYALGAGTSDGQRFRVLRPHARGGLGMIFVALDTELHREVALKQIHDRHADDPGSRARFLIEAEITGGLEHPGIVPVYGLGTYEDGRPYYAMRFISGDSLKEAIDRFHADEASGNEPGRRSLELRKLLRRFTDVCNAIDYAHSRGVLHRDIKPSNIILGRHGETLVVDWGLAKATGRSDPAAGERTLMPSSASGSAETLPGSALGTPAYMSPEQADGHLDRLGPRSDVYSLGATLYCLLTGRPPFEGDVADVIRVVQQGDFRPPRQLDSTIDAALEAVCIRAMALKPEDRYDSCRALADDIERWMADEPVSARRDPWPARLGRWGRRHRSLVATAVAILGTATIGLAAGLWVVSAERTRTELARRGETEQRKLAEAREKEARDKKDEARAVLGFVQDKILAAARPEGVEGGLGHAVTLRAALEAALPQVESSFHGRPLVESSVRVTLANSFYYLGEAAMAAKQAEIARERYTALLGPDHPNTLMIMNNLAVSYTALGRNAEALKLHEEALASRKAKLGPDHPDTLQSMSNLADSYAHLGRYEEALRLREETLALQKEKLGPDHPYTLGSMNSLANSYYDLGRYAEALRLREETLALQKAKVGPDDPDTLRSMNNLANSYYDLGRHAEALKLNEEAFALRKSKLGPDHPDTLWSMGNLARSYTKLGQHAEALKLNEEALALRKSKLGTDHPDTLWSMGNLANTYAALGRNAEALKLCDETQALMKVKLAPHDPYALMIMHNLTNTYATLGRHSDALKLNGEVLALRKGKLGPDHPDTLLSMANFAESLVRLDRCSEAAAIIDDCLRRTEGKVVAPEFVTFVWELRLQAFAKQKDGVGCRQTAERWERLELKDSDSLYEAACFRAVTAGVLRAGAQTPEAVQQAGAEANRAMSWLEKAVAAGYHRPGHVAHMTRDHDLDALRDRADFRRLLAELMDPAFPADPFAR